MVGTAKLKVYDTSPTQYKPRIGFYSGYNVHVLNIVRHFSNDVLYIVHASMHACMICIFYVDRSNLSPSISDMSWLQNSNKIIHLF